MNTMVTSLSGLVLRNLTRFVTSDFYPERMRKAKDYEYTVLAGQAIKETIHYTLVLPHRMI